LCGGNLKLFVLVLIKRCLKIIEGSRSMLKVEGEEGTQKSPLPVGNK